MAIPEIIFEPTIEALLAEREQAGYTAFSGGNNSGKSLVLKEIKLRLGMNAYLVGPQRFYHIAELATQRFNEQDYANWDAQFRSNAANKEYNFEQNFIDLGRILGGLKDVERNQLFELCSALIGNTFTLKKRDEENELSPRYVDMDGQNLATGSTGTRLLMTLLGLCMDKKFDVLLIDEPELGLSPRVQMTLGSFLADPARRREYFPHLKHVLVATHSHLMLDRQNITNNFIVSKKQEVISIRQVVEMSELHHLQFNLLGNSLEALFLPSAFVIVEGKTDKPYIGRLLQIHHPGKNVLVIEGQGDVKRVFRTLTTSMGDFWKSPFRPRVFVVLDSVHTVGTRTDLEKMGAVPSNIIEWEGNGIEYVYPRQVLSGIFQCSPEDLNNLEIDDDRVSMNGISRRKSHLCEEVVGSLNASTVLPDELTLKLLNPLARSIDG